MVGGAPGVVILLCRRLKVHKGGVSDGVPGLGALSPEYPEGAGWREDGFGDKRSVTSRFVVGNRVG